VFSSIDLQAGYHQILIDEEDRPKTAFKCSGSPGGLYEWVVMGFGLTNAPATFSATMHAIFKPCIDRGFLTVYLDDLLIHSRSAEEHEQHLREVLQIMADNQLYAKASKCEWNRTEVTFLGHLVGIDGIRMDPKKTAVIADWKQPVTQKELRSFLGLANYFRKFILGYATVAAPLNELLKATTPADLTGVWTAHHTECFDCLKRMCADEIVLQYPDFDKPFELVSDASLLGTGAVLLQDGRPIAYTSKKFSSAERNYTTGEQELLGVINALKEWRCYLEGPQVTLVTDHHPLTSLSHTPLSRRQARWLEYLQRFHITWQYRPGRLNVADPISRNPALQVMSHAILTRSRAAKSFTDQIAAAYASDPWFTVAANVSDCTLAADGLWKRPVKLREGGSSMYVTVLPSDRELITAVIRQHHDGPLSGHMGRQRTLDLISRTYWWPTMRADVEAHVRACDSCQRNKARAGQPHGQLMPIPYPDLPWQSVGMDFVTGLPPTAAGFDAICVMVDRCTKMVRIAPCVNLPTASESADIMLMHVVRHHGMPTDVISDRGSQFVSQFWQALCKLVGMESKTSTAYHPQTDGQTERANRVVIDTLRSYCDEVQGAWDTHVPLVEFAMNNAVNASTGMSPFYALYGLHPRVPSMLMVDNTVPGARQYAETLDRRMQRAKRCVQAAQERMKATYDKNHKPAAFKVSDMVLLSTKNLMRSATVRGVAGLDNAKLFPKFIGPYKVTRVIKGQACELALPENYRIHNVFHVNLLQPYHTDGRYQPPKPPPIDLWDGQPVWKVERILDHAIINLRAKVPKYKYLIRWEGYPPEDDTWEPATQFTEPSVIQEYWDKLGRPMPK
jgi:transposase InsO family protein